MKAQISALLLGTILALTACTRLGQGTPGGSGYETGMAHAEGSTPYAAGRTSPPQRDGLANTTIAVSRHEASLDVSGSGTGELSRRSAAATFRSADEPLAPAGERLTLSTEHVTADKILADRIRLALGSTTPGAATVEPLSIQTLNNLRIDLRNGIVTLRGRVATPEQRDAIGNLIRGIEGVRAFENRLEVIPPAREQ